MMKPLALLLFFISTAFAQQFDPQWMITRPHPQRIFLTHQSQKKFILLTKLKSAGSVSAFEEYFAASFPEAALRPRREILETHVQTGSATWKGVRYGAVSGRALNAVFHERIWRTKEYLWHLAMVTFQDSNESFREMDHIMETINGAPRTTFFKLFSSFAYAQDNQCMAEATSFLELSDIVTRLSPKANCESQNIHPSHLSSQYGLKLDRASGRSCLNGSSEAFKKMKEGFLSTMETITRKTDENINKHCREPKKGAGFLASLAFSKELELYQQCLVNASTSAAVTHVTDSVVQTAKSLRDLYHWVKAEQDPMGVMISFLAARYEGFLCLTADAQLKAVCEFGANIFTGIAASATSAGVVLSIDKGLKAVRALVAVQKMAKTPGEARALELLNKRAEGVKPLFKNKHSFVQQVAEGKAEAAKVAEKLRQGAILTKTPEEMDLMLKSQGFTRIDSCIKFEGKCVKHINPKTQKEEVAPMVLYIHPSGIAARIKPDGQSNAKFRSGPHGSFSLFDPQKDNLPEALSKVRNNPSEGEKFVNQYLDWDSEIAKINIETGLPLPAAPARTVLPAGLSKEEAGQFHDAIADMTHFPLKE